MKTFSLREAYRDFWLPGLLAGMAMGILIGYLVPR